MKYDLFFGIDSDGNFDIAIEDGDIKMVDQLDAMIKLSLFTDARATPEMVSDPLKRRGWLGEVATLDSRRIIGSHLWLVDQSRLTQNNLNAAISFAQTALTWISEDEHCKDIRVTGDIVPRKGFQLIIDIELDDRTENFFYNLWE